IDHEHVLHRLSSLTTAFLSRGPFLGRGSVLGCFSRVRALLGDGPLLRGATLLCGSSLFTRGSLLPRAALLGRTTLLRGASLFRCTGLLRGWPRRRLRRMERKRRPLRVAEDGDRTATRNLHWRTLNECAVLGCDVNSLL